VAFLEGRLFSSQSGLFEIFSDFSDWLDKSRHSKKATLVFDHVNRLMITSIGAGFLSRLFFSQYFFFFSFESYVNTFDWLEKSLDRKLALIEVIM